MFWEWVWECLNNYINFTTVRGQRKNRMKEHNVINSSKKAHTSGEEKERISLNVSLCPGHVGDTKLPTTVKRGSFSVKSTAALVSLRVHVFGRNTRLEVRDLLPTQHSFILYTGSQSLCIFFSDIYDRS